MNKVQIIKKSQYKTTNWSGGTTSEIFIYPESSQYANRDFMVRISSATVDLEESTFTSLPKYHRFITMLDGTVNLTHNDNIKVTLSPYEIHEFEGSDNTLSIGRATDFNLMIDKSQCRGFLSHYKISLMTTITLKKGLNLIFSPTDTIDITVDKKEYTIDAKDSLYIYVDSDPVPVIKFNTLDKDILFASIIINK